MTSDAILLSKVEPRVREIMQEHCNRCGFTVEEVLSDNIEDDEIKLETDISSDIYTFIDLCSGIGGFHKAIERCGEEISTKCVLSSDIDKKCRKTYFLNFGIPTHNDLTKISLDKFKNTRVDIVCAGFPCQPFSIAGKRMGLDDPRGTIIYEIFKIIQCVNPKIVLLENVKGLKSIRNRRGEEEQEQGNKTKIYEWILLKFQHLGYFYYDRVLSPIDICIPQNRDRVVIMAVRIDLVRLDPKFTQEEFFVDREQYMNTLIQKRRKRNQNLCIFETQISEEYKLSKLEHNVVSLWRNFISMEEWDSICREDLCKCVKHTKVRNYKQMNFFTDFLYYKDTNRIPQNLRIQYCRKSDTISVTTKKLCVELNNLYENNTQFQKLVDTFLERNATLLSKIPYTWRTLEYNGGVDFGSQCNIDDFYGLFRMSGFRVRKSTSFPTLVKSGPRPFLIAKSRYLTNTECARLQSFGDSYIFLNRGECDKQTGNAVNTEVVELMLRNALNAIRVLS